MATMTVGERKTHERLLRRWATGRASHSEMLRCMELDRKSANETRDQRKGEGYERAQRMV